MSVCIKIIDFENRIFKIKKFKKYLLILGIKAALRAPRTSNLVNEQIRGNNYNPLNSCAFNGTSNMTNHNHSNGNSSGLINGANNSSQRLVNMAGRFDASALHIQHGLNATKLQSNYRPPTEHTKITEFLVSNFKYF